MEVQDTGSLSGGGRRFALENWEGRSGKRCSRRCSETMREVDMANNDTITYSGSAAQACDRKIVSMRVILSLSCYVRCVRDVIKCHDSCLVTCDHFCPTDPPIPLSLLLGLVWPMILPVWSRQSPWA